MPQKFVTKVTFVSRVGKGWALNDMVVFLKGKVSPQKKVATHYLDFDLVIDDVPWHLDGLS